MKVFDLFKVDWLGLVAPAECYGDFSERLALYATVPIILIGFVVFCSSVQNMPNCERPKVVPSLEASGSGGVELQQASYSAGSDTKDTASILINAPSDADD